MVKGERKVKEGITKAVLKVIVERADVYSSSQVAESDAESYANKAVEDVNLLAKEVERLQKLVVKQEKELKKQEVEVLKQGEKPTCKCGLEMRVIKFKGYYDSFKFWGYDKNCKCTKNIRVRDFEADEVIEGAYT